MWIWNPNELLSIDIIPEENDSCADIVNKGTRMLIIILLIMWYFSYTQLEIVQVIIMGAILITIVCTWITNKKEMFSPLPNNIYMESAESIPQTPIQQLLTEPPAAITTIESLSSSTISALTLSKEQKEQSFPRMERSVWNGYQQERVSQPKEHIDYYSPYMGENTNMKKERVMIAPRLLDPQFTNSNTSFLGNENPLQDFGGMGFTEPPSRRKQSHSLLFEPTVDESSTPIKPNRMFLQDVQPHQYSYTNDRTPINANLGISSTPQIPPLSRQTIQGDDGKIYPLYSRIDPELVRDDVPLERREEMPQRGPWSERLPETNPLNESTIYDPRHTGYGDSARAYYDSNLGNVRYYYSDVDSYRSPNFIIRNKVDHVDFVDPMDKVYSEYPRTASLEDVHDQVQTDWMAKSTEFREDIMEKLMRKNNAMNWQMRFAPKSKGARLSTFTSSY
jgi:hypothetical protein